MNKQVSNIAVRDETALWNNLRKAGYYRGCANNIVDSTRLVLASLISPSEASMGLYHDDRLLRQLELQDYLLSLGVKCQVNGIDEAREALRERRSSLGAALRAIETI